VEGTTNLTREYHYKYVIEIVEFFILGDKELYTEIIGTCQRPKPKEKNDDFMKSYSQK